MWQHKKRENVLPETDNFTVLGKDVSFKGIVHFEGTVQLESSFEGEIHSKGVLVVGEHARIRGTITVGTLVSAGKICGDVSATEKVQLLKSAVQIGDVHAPTISIEEGASFQGYADTGHHHAADQNEQSTDIPSDPSAERDETMPGLIEGQQ